MYMLSLNRFQLLLEKKKMFSINRLYKGREKDLEDWLSNTYASVHFPPVIPAASRTRMEDLEVSRVSALSLPGVQRPVPHHNVETSQATNIPSNLPLYSQEIRPKQICPKASNQHTTHRPTAQPY